MHASFDLPDRSVFEPVTMSQAIVDVIPAYDVAEVEKKPARRIMSSVLSRANVLSGTSGV